MKPGLQKIRELPKAVPPINRLNCVGGFALRDLTGHAGPEIAVGSRKGEEMSTIGVFFAGMACGVLLVFLGFAVSWFVGLVETVCYLLSRNRST